MSLVRKVVNLARHSVDAGNWPEIRRKVVQLAFRRDDVSTAAEAAERCQALAVPPDTLLRQLGFANAHVVSFAAAQPERLAAAKTRLAAVQARMGGAAYLDLLYTCTLLLAPKRIVETGVAFGWSSLAILSAIEHDPDATLTSIDMPYLTRNVDRSVGGAVPLELRGAWTLLRGADRQHLPAVLATGEPIDLVHYDSDKSYDGRMWAYPRLWDALAAGGLLISDDIQDNTGFLDFVDSIGVAPIVAAVPGTAKYIGAIRKRA